MEESIWWSSGMKSVRQFPVRRYQQLWSQKWMHLMNGLISHVNIPEGDLWFSWFQFLLGDVIGNRIKDWRRFWKLFLLKRHRKMIPTDKCRYVLTGIMYTALFVGRHVMFTTVWKSQGDWSHLCRWNWFKMQRKLHNIWWMILRKGVCMFASFIQIFMGNNYLGRFMKRGLFSHED